MLTHTKSHQRTPDQRFPATTICFSVSPYHIAIACNGLNDRSEAIAWLERAFEARDPMMVFLNVEPTWKNLHDEPRFRALVKRMSFT